MLSLRAKLFVVLLSSAWICVTSTQSHALQPSILQHSNVTTSSQRAFGIGIGTDSNGQLVADVNDSPKLIKVRIFEKGKDHLNAFTGEYAQARPLFKGTGSIITITNQNTESYDFGTYEFVGNCRTVVTAAHVIFNSKGALKEDNWYMSPGGNFFGPDRLAINLEDALHEGRIYYGKRNQLSPNKNTQYDVAAITLKRGFPGCGAYGMYPLSERDVSELRNGGLYSVAFDAGILNKNNVPIMELDPSCKALNDGEVDLSYLDASNFDERNLLYQDCDDLKGASGSGDFITVNHQVRLVALSVRDLDGGGKYPPVGPEELSEADSYKYPNISIRLRSPYFETHRSINMTSLSNSEYRSMKYQCIRARERKKYPAFWIIADAIHEFHGHLTARQRRACSKNEGAVALR